MVREGGYDGRDVFEVAVVVENGRVVLHGVSGDQSVHRASGAKGSPVPEPILYSHDIVTSRMGFALAESIELLHELGVILARASGEPILERDGRTYQHVRGAYQLHDLL